MKNAIRKLTCILLSAVLLFSMTACGKSSKPRNYENTKAEALDLFHARKDEFLAVVAEFENFGATDFSIKGVSSISCKEDGDYKCIEFKIDAYGFLGGQYWSLSYHSGNYPYNSWGFKLNDLTAGPYAGSYYWQENPNEGNNFFAIERIEEDWFFHYMDFDGNGHELDWAKSSVE